MEQQRDSHRGWARWGRSVWHGRMVGLGVSPIRYGGVELSRSAMGGAGSGGIGGAQGFSGWGCGVGGRGGRSGGLGFLARIGGWGRA